MTKVAPPLTERQAARIKRLGLLADEPAGLLDAWSDIDVRWSDAVAQAMSLPSDRLETRVNSEWSFIETLRHLIFVTDAWIRDVVLEKRSQYDPIGLAPHFITDRPELDPDARPSLTSVLVARHRRLVEVRDVIAETTLDGLDRCCAAFDGQFTVLGAFQNVIFEEWAHQYYATKDLASLR